MADNSNTLNVQVTADVASLNKGLAQADKSIKGFSTAANTMTGKTTKMAKSVKVNAVPAMTSFSQVIQDAPYGIRGVANNIQQLTSQFGYLSVKTGGAKGALKAMVGSLTGPAGILFAVSAVTSLLVSYSDEITALISKKGALSNAFKDASSDIGEEISKLEKLTTALNNDNLSLENKRKLIDKIKKDYPSYLGKLSDDEIAHKDITKAINKEKSAIIGLGITKALEAKKAPIYANIAELSLKTDRDLGVEGLSGMASESVIKEQGAKKRNSLEKLYKDELQKITDTINTTIDKYKVDYNSLFDFDDDKKPPKINTFKNETIDVLKTFVAEAKPIAQELNNTLSNAIPSSEIIDAKTANMMASLAKFNSDASKLIQSSISSTFADLGTSIGEAMANGTDVFSAAGNAILGGIGNFLSQLGKMMIEYGVAALAYSIASKALLNPVTAAPAAGALIAAGAILTTIGGAISSSVSSGGSDTSTDYSSGSTSSSYGSSSSYSSSSGGGGTYVFEIQGTKLVGVLKNTLDRNKALGGQLSIT